MANTAARIGYNCDISYSATVGGSYTSLGEVIKLKPPGISVDEHQADTLGKLVKEFVQGLLEYKPCTIKIRWAPENTTHQAILTKIRARSKHFWKIILPQADGTAGSGANYTVGPFEAFVKDFEPGEVANDGTIEADITLRYTGDTTNNIPYTGAT